VDETRAALPAELEARIAAIEADPSDTDFDWPSWVWMILFGAVLPVALLMIGLRQ
jgi:hypothetical protein